MRFMSLSNKKHDNEQERNYWFISCDICHARLGTEEDIG